jgi:hypothetical protein
MSADPREGEIVVIPYPDGDKSLAAEKDSPANDVEELERTADALRGNLGELVGELGKRGKQALLPVGIGAAVLGAAGVMAALLLRRRRARRTPYVHNLTEALRRAVTHPDRVAKPDPHGVSRIAIAAGTAAASMVARRLVQRWLKEPSRTDGQLAVTE